MMMNEQGRKKGIAGALSLSGNVSVSNSDSSTENKVTGILTKNATSALSSSGSVFPNFNESWMSQKFQVFFFLIDKGDR